MRGFVEVRINGTNYGALLPELDGSSREDQELRDLFLTPLYGTCGSACYSGKLFMLPTYWAPTSPYWTPNHPLNVLITEMCFLWTDNAPTNAPVVCVRVLYCLLSGEL